MGNIIYYQDTAGEEKYHALAPLYYRGSDGAILVFDLSKKESFDLVNKWFKEIKGYDSNIQVLLVGNKCDIGKYQIDIEEAKKLATEYGACYLSASALDGKNIKEIFSTLAVGSVY